MGKTQLAENKPAAAFVENRPIWATPEDMQEINEEIESMQKAQQRTNARATKVSKFMKDNFFRTDKTFVYLYHPVWKRQLSVRYFFPKKNLAIDQFMQRDKEILAEVEFKKNAFKGTGVKYFPMFPENKLLDLAEYL